MPNLNGADTLKYYVIPIEQADEVQAWWRGLSDAPQGDEDTYVEVGESAELVLAERSACQVQHGLTVYPSGAPGYNHYEERYGPLTERSDYDPSDLLYVVYDAGVELCPFPLLLVNLFAPEQLVKLVRTYEDILREPIFERERRFIELTVAVLRAVRAGEVVVLVYWQWT